MIFFVRSVGQLSAAGAVSWQRSRSVIELGGRHLPPARKSE